MLHSTDLGEPNEELAGMASDLADISERQGKAGLARLLTSFARARFRSKDDFIRQAASHLREHLATHGLQIVTLLLGFVLNQNDWMRDKALQMLKLILSFPESRALAPHSRELVRPLLRLVSTKHAAVALDILELPFAQADPSVAEANDQLFGPFEPSGWSIPNATERSEVTRANVSAVFNTCAVETRAASAHFSVLQFSDLRGVGSVAKHEAWGASQASLELPSPPMSVPDNASMGDLVGALHSLNQFFDEGLDMAPSASTSPLAARRVAPTHQTHFPRVSSTDSLGVARIMARGMVRSPSANLSRERSEGESEGYALASDRGYLLHNPPRYALSTDSFTSSTEGPTSVRPGSSQARHEAAFYGGSSMHGLAQQHGNGTHLGQGTAAAQHNGLAAAFTPMPVSRTKRVGGLYVHAAHQPSYSSESEFGVGDNVFSLDDSHEQSFRSVSGTSASLHASGGGGPSPQAGAAGNVSALSSHSSHSHSHVVPHMDDVLDAPVRPWNTGSDRSRTPSPRDAHQ